MEAMLPLVDLSGLTANQVLVDREPGQYLGQVTTALLEDGRTLFATYPKGHGKGPIVLKKSIDAGATWSERLSTPASWETSRETPTIHRVIDSQGKQRLLLFSGLHPIRMSYSEDDGETWSELSPIGAFGGVVTMSSLIAINTGTGHYLGLFHDDGRFIGTEGNQTDPVTFTLYKTISCDGGLTWSEPVAIYAATDLRLCEPGAVRSPNGHQLAVVLRENSRRKGSHIIFSNDEGGSWTTPRELPTPLCGDRHVGCYASDGRLVFTFRDRDTASPTMGDWVAWVGSYEDLVQGRQGQYKIRFMDNLRGADTAYSGLVLTADGRFVATSYGHWSKDEAPYIVSVSFRLSEIDALLRTQS